MSNYQDFDIIRCNIKRNKAYLNVLWDYLKNIQNNNLILQNIDLNVLSKIGTPFLWLNIDRLIRNNNEIERKFILNLVKLNIIDSIFHIKKIDLNIDYMEKNCFYFPSIDIFIEDINKYADIFKIKREFLKINENIKIFHLHKKNKNMILYGFDEQEILEIEENPDMHIFYKNLNLSLNMTKKADKNLFFKITKLIRFLVPIKEESNDDFDISKSFSNSKLIGVIFISNSNLQLFLEALIHEFYHNELHSVMQFKVFISENKKLLYYSPWREDARPLFGLYHAIYVFTHIVCFYDKLLSCKLEEDFLIFIKDRLYKIFSQLYLAFNQINLSCLTKVGTILIKDLFLNYKLLLKKYNFSFFNCPKQVFEHFNKWQSINGIVNFKKDLNHDDDLNLYNVYPNNFIKS